MWPLSPAGRGLSTAAGVAAPEGCPRGLPPSPAERLGLSLTTGGGLASSPSGERGLSFPLSEELTPDAEL